MYLTELYRFYERMTQDPQSGMPPEGMSAEAIHFALVIGEDGSLRGVHDLRDSKGKPLRRFVPAAVSRSSNVAANVMPCWAAVWSSSLKAKTAFSTKNRPWAQA